MKKSVCLFEKNLTATAGEIMSTRAKLVVSNTRYEAENAFRAAQHKVNNIQSKIDMLSDLGPDNNTSLRPVSTDYNPANWIAEQLKLEEELALAEIELDIAKKVYAKFFGKLPVEKEPETTE